MTLKEAKQKLCLNCSCYQWQMRNFPVGVDDDGHIIYRRHASKCHPKPITKDGSVCPYFKELKVRQEISAYG